MYTPTGDELVTLMGLSESDDRILDLFDKMGIKLEDIERDKDIGDFMIDYIDKYGFALEFSSILPANFTLENGGGNYFIYINFNYIFNALPYEIDDKDNLETIEKKLGKKANYISKRDETELAWIYEDLGVFTVEFEDSNHTEIMNIIINLYEDPHLDYPKGQGWLDVYKPFER